MTYKSRDAFARGRHLCLRKSNGDSLLRRNGKLFLKRPVWEDQRHTGILRVTYLGSEW